MSVSGCWSAYSSLTDIPSFARSKSSSALSNAASLSATFRSSGAGPRISHSSAAPALLQALQTLRPASWPASWPSSSGSGQTMTLRPATAE